MPLRNTKPLTIRPVGITDSLDGTNQLGPGSMASLQNLVPAPHTRSIMVPRPASTLVTDFDPPFTGPLHGEALLVVGPRYYGMIATGRFPGRSEPFAYDSETNAFVTIQGVAADNTPLTQPTTGDWIPPTMAQVGGRVIVTHPGFADLGTPNKYFGVIDMTGGSISGLATLNGTTTIIGGPALYFAQPGWVITGLDVPAGTTVVATSQLFLARTGDTHSNTTLDNLSGIIYVGMTVDGPGIVPGTTIAADLGAGAFQLSIAATATAVGVSLALEGATITMSQAATAGAVENVAINGGNFLAPLWAAINTNPFQLPNVPVAVAQFAGRAWFAHNSPPSGSDHLGAVTFSDSGAAVTVSNSTAVQTLTFQNGLHVNALAPLGLNNALVGGIVQSLIAFQGGTNYQQITGDQSTNNLQVNNSSEAVGTLAPLSIASTPAGLMFIAPDGLRIIDQQGNASPPLGTNGDGIAQPFINAVWPTRMSAAYNEDIYRISVYSALSSGGIEAGGPVWQEFWFHVKLKSWSGPHTFPARHIRSLQSSSATHPPLGFVLFSSDTSLIGLWFSDSLPRRDSVYIENDAQMRCIYRTSLQPDNQEMAQNCVIESSFFTQIPYGMIALIKAVNDDQQILDHTFLVGLPSPQSLWGSMVWGEGAWGTGFSLSPDSLWGEMVWGDAVWGGGTIGDAVLSQRRLAWTQPLVFKQAALVITIPAAANVALGNLYVRYEVQGYQLPPQPVPPGYLLDDNNVPILDDQGNPIMVG